MNLLLPCIGLSVLYSGIYCTAIGDPARQPGIPQQWYWDGTVRQGSVGFNLSEDASATCHFRSCCIIYLCALVIGIQFNSVYDVHHYEDLRHIAIFLTKTCFGRKSTICHIKHLYKYSKFEKNVIQIICALLCTYCTSVMRIRMNYYTDPDPGSGNPSYESGSGSKEKSSHNIQFFKILKKVVLTYRFAALYKFG